MTAIERLSNNLTLPEVDQTAILKHLGINASDPAAQALILVCQRYDLDPILKHALLIKGRLYVTRDGLMHIAHRSGKFDGMEVLEQAETPTHFTARVSVYRKDMSRAFTYIGRYPKTGQIAKDYGPEMAVKVGEVMCLRRAFDVALGAAEERWDDEAQRELAQADNPISAAPQQAQARTVDVTRQIAQATNPNAALEAWVGKITEAGTKINSLGGRERAVAALAHFPEWRRDTDQAKAAFEALCEVGRQIKAEQAVPAIADEPPFNVAPAEELLLSDAQRKALCAHAGRAGAKTSEDRAALWGYSLNSVKPEGTKTLTTEQASILIDTFSGWDNSEAEQTLSEARRAFKPAAEVA